MATRRGRIIDHFYGGITRDEKSRIDGSALNIEEIDIFENAHYVRAAQIMTKDAIPSSSPSVSSSSSPSASTSSSPSASPSISSASPSSSASASPYYDDYSAAGLTTNIAGHWTLDETSGTRYDTTANNIDLGDGGGVGYTTGALGNAADFTASESDQLVTGGSGGIDGGSITMGCWIKLKSEPGTDVTYCFMSQSNSSTNVGYEFGYRDNGGVKQLFFERARPGATSNTVTYNITLGTSEWHYIAMTYAASGSVKGYYNGELVGTPVSSSGNGSAAIGSSISIGSRYWASDMYANTYIDEAAMWSIELSESQIESLYHAGSPLPYSASSSPSSSSSSSPSTSASSSPSTSGAQISTELHAYTGDSSDNVWGYGYGSNDEVALFKVANGGADTPGDWSTVLVSGDTTNKAFDQSPIAFHKTTEGSNPESIYYLKKVNSSVYLVRYNIGAAAEQRWNGSAWTASGSLDSNTQLTGLNGSFDRYFMRVEYGELYIGNGNYIAKVENDATFTEKAFTLPTEWEAVDIAFVNDIGLILARNINRLMNYCKAYYWDLTSTTQFENVITIPHGGPQWIINFKERLFALCAINGSARFYTSVASPGVPLQELPGMELQNVASETSTQVISAPKMLSTKDNVLYFGLYKTDKTGIYAIGSLDEDKPFALILAKRFSTSNYANHVPIAIYTQGPNFYASYTDSGAFEHARCESNNSPDRSSNAIYESLILDEGDTTKEKDVTDIYVMTKPLTTGTSVSCYIATNYGSYTQVYREDASSHSTVGSVLCNFKPRSASGKVFQIKTQLTSNGSVSPFVTGIAYITRIGSNPAYG